MDSTFAFQEGHEGPKFFYRVNQPAVKIDEQVPEFKEYATDRKIKQIGPKA